MSNLDTQSLQTYFTKPWYLQSWFIGLLYASWILIIPLIPAIVLTIIDILDTKKKSTRIKELHLDKLAKLTLLEDTLAEKMAHSSAFDSLQQTNHKLATEQKRLTELTSNTSEASKQLIAIQSEVDLQEYGFYGVNFELDTSTEYKARIISLQEDQKRMVRNNTACEFSLNFTFNNSLSEGRKVIKKHIKLALWAFNTHCDNVMTNVTYKNYSLSERKIRRAIEIINESDALLAISEGFLALKLQELDATFKFKEKKEQEKELLREQRAEELEEKKLQQEIQTERAKIEKDEKHISTELARLQKMLLEERGNKVKLENEIANFEGKLTQLGEKKQAVDYREVNSKAGYVYIISNLGSFGEDIVKIGVTRRLEPVERINELGDASVPVRFDIHALIFSDEAYKLEHTLHEKFREKRVNMVNNRKEFFRIPLDEIKKAIVEEFKSSVDFTTERPAREFRKTLR